MSVFPQIKLKCEIVFGEQTPLTSRCGAFDLEPWRETNQQRKDGSMIKESTTPVESKTGQELLGKRLCEVRSYLGFSMEEVANALGLPLAALSDAESGKLKLEEGILRRLAKLYSYPVEYFKDVAFEISLTQDSTGFIQKAEGISEHDRKELTMFLKYLQATSQSEKDLA